MLEPLWKALEEVEEIDLQEAILKAGLPGYEARMAVRQVLMDFTIKWKKLQNGWSLARPKKREEGICKLAKSDLFRKIMLLEKCENSKVTPEGLDLKLWWEKLRFNKTVSVMNPMFDVNNPFAPKLTYSYILEKRNDISRR